MRKVADAFAWMTLIAAAVAIPLYSVDMYRHGAERKLIAWYSAGAFVALTWAISMREIYLHLSHWFMPDVQKFVVRILWMVPLYSIESWLSLRFKDFSLYIETLRECYEALVVYSFFYFLVTLLGEETSLLSVLRRKPPERGQHPFPLSCCIRPWAMNYDFFVHCKLGVLQYVIIKNLTAIVTMVLEANGWYDENSFAPNRGFLYVTLVNNASQMWAVYCLILFYFAVKEELLLWRPVGKFMCVKLVVFFTWWQSILISMLQQSHLIKNNEEEDLTGDEIAKGLQNYLICVEMFVAAIAHRFSFTYTDYCQKRTRQRGGEGGNNTSSSNGSSRGRSPPPLPSSSSSSPGYHLPLSSSSRSSSSLHPTGTFSPPPFKSQGHEGGEENGGEEIEDGEEIEEEEEEERASFFRAFLESSVPHDLISDIGLMASGRIRTQAMRDEEAGEDGYGGSSELVRYGVGKEGELTFEFEESEDGVLVDVEGRFLLGEEEGRELQAFGSDEEEGEEEEERKEEEPLLRAGSTSLRASLL